MRTTTLLTAILLLSAVAPATVAADDGENLRERNLDYLLEGFDHGIPEEATATLMTNAGTQTVPATEALEAALDHLDRAQIDLAALAGGAELNPTPAAAGQESFPLAGTSGLIVEQDRGPGPLPPGGTCDKVKKQPHQISTNTLSDLEPVFTQPGDGFVTSTLSEAITASGFTVATMGEDTGTLNDTVTGYSGAILAGPNYFTTCVDIELCFFGFCSHILLHTTTLSTGVVLDGEIAQLVHDEEPLAALPG